MKLLVTLLVALLRAFRSAGSVLSRRIVSMRAMSFFRARMAPGFSELVPLA